MAALSSRGPSANEGAFSVFAREGEPSEQSRRNVEGVKRPNATAEGFVVVAAGMIVAATPNPKGGCVRTRWGHPPHATVVAVYAA